MRSTADKTGHRRGIITAEAKRHRITTKTSTSVRKSLDLMRQGVSKLITYR